MKTALLKSIHTLTDLLMFRKRDNPLLLLRDKEITIYLWQGEGFDSGTSFVQTTEGQKAFAHFLEGRKWSGCVHLMVDIIEEELRTETIPKLRWSNRTGIIQRRLEKMFRYTPYRRYEAQGWQLEEGERILFSGLTAPHLLQPWINLLVEHHIPISGLWSFPLLSRALLSSITSTTANALLVSLNASGQRHTYFHQGRTLVSRLISCQHAPSEQVSAVHAEINRTRLYLNVLRLLQRGTQLDVYLLCDSEQAQSLMDSSSSVNDCNIQQVLTETLAKQMGLTQKSSLVGADLLIAYHLLKNPPPSHYILPEISKDSSLSWLGALKRLKSVAEVVTPENNPVDKPIRRVGDLLLEKGVITRDQLDIALSEQQRLGQPLGKTLITMGFISEDAMRDLLGEALEQESVDLNLREGDTDAIAMIPREFARKHAVLPLVWDENTQKLTVAMANTFNMAVLDKLHALLPKGVVVRPMLAGESELAIAIDRFYGFELSVDGILREIETGEVDLESLDVDAGTFSHPMSRLVNALLTDAVKRGASDVHINPMANYAQVRFRIDGVLQEARTLQKKFLSGLVVRIKVMSTMDIAEVRIPQDGHFSLVVSNVNIDFRVSSQPTAHGENIVLRILDRHKGVVSLGQLGLADENISELNRMVARPDGIILVTGPTGSGKTTTLYSLLSTLDAKKSNIMTLEDPVEYLLDSILQTSVNKAVNLDFSTGVRSMLRQDPDVILVGEIRDMDTAQMALRAAMTGHQVYSTFHANSALASISHLLNIGLRPDMLAGNIIGIVAQRLVRRLCPSCKKAYMPKEDGVRSLLGLERSSEEIYASVGCDACGGTGYKGRMAVMEGILIDEEFDDLISNNAPHGEYRRLARKKGLKVMADYGRKRVREGVTSLEEINRIFGWHHQGE